MASLNFDYINGSVVIQHGTIFYSPNCSRAVDLPCQMPHMPDPFKQPRLNTSMFKQPIWWSGGWAWLSFIPLAPSFLFTSFEPLCHMPRIEEVDFSFIDSSGESRSEVRFRMAEADITCWIEEEQRIVQLAHFVKLRYGIWANTPPKPSSFHFDRAHKSHPIAKRMICLAREWFAIWMGHLSYIIAKAETLVPNGERDVSTPLPDWYNCLRKEPIFSEAWLEGLINSTVCAFDLQTPRAGIIFQWSEEDRYRDSIEFFYKNHIPLFFIWSSKEEQAILSNHMLSYLQPPDLLVEAALTSLFNVPNVPLAGLIIQQYFHLGANSVDNKTLELLRLQYAPSFVFQFTTDEFLSQGTALKKIKATAGPCLQALKASRDNQLSTNARAASSFPFQGLLATTSTVLPSTVPPSPSSFPAPQERGRIYNHFDDFFAARSKRQEELMKVESPKDRQRRISREQQPGFQKATMFVWEKAQSSGGRQLYKRVKVDRRYNELTFHDFKSHQRLYNAFANEWDLCEDFCFSPIDDSDSDDEYDSDGGYDNGYPQEFVSQPRPTLPAPVEVDAPMHCESDEALSVLPYCTDPLEAMVLVYGYLPRMGPNDRPSTHSWDSVLGFLGFVNTSELLEVEASEKNAMLSHFDAVVSQIGSKEADDLLAKAFENLSGAFTFEHVQRPSIDLFVFSSPRSNACQWVLGVHSAVAALYVCRYILENPHAHNILTVALRLLDRGIPFRSLLPLSCSPRQCTIVKPYSPRAYRLTNYKFTKADFDVSMRACQSVLASPQGRAALLQGGIVGRIAKEYLSKDSVLDGPSFEVTVHQIGYHVPSSNSDIHWCDDELTEDEIAVICGTYSLYTGKSSLHSIYVNSNDFSGIPDQVAVWSWFPPPLAWKHARSGCNWLDWTERCENIFLDILKKIESGKAQPKSRSDWISFLRGQATSRMLVKQNNARSEQFMNKVVPTG